VTAMAATKAGGWEKCGGRAAGRLIIHGGDDEFVVSGFDRNLTHKVP
jgi:hypothetical protein